MLLQTYAFVIYRSYQGSLLYRLSLRDRLLGGMLTYLTYSQFCSSCRASHPYYTSTWLYHCLKSQEEPLGWIFSVLIATVATTVPLYSQPLKALLLDQGQSRFRFRGQVWSSVSSPQITLIFREPSPIWWTKITLEYFRNGLALYNKCMIALSCRVVITEKVTLREHQTRSSQSTHNIH